MAIWSIWEDENGDVSLNQGDGPQRGINGAAIDPTDRLVKIFEAATLDEAILRKNWYYGWEPSSPMGDAPAPRDVDRLVEACRAMVSSLDGHSDAYNFGADDEAASAAGRAALAAIDGPGETEGR